MPREPPQKFPGDGDTGAHRHVLRKGLKHREHRHRGSCCQREIVPIRLSRIGPEREKSQGKDQVATRSKRIARQPAI